jgi:hypothetical protein
MYTQLGDLGQMKKNVTYLRPIQVKNKDKIQCSPKGPLKKLTSFYWLVTMVGLSNGI